ncbi:transcription initiation factor TFIID subunit 7-like [Momordica charantia]|uniref:Transcription initiation factor TFIID subunit 7-like n=1 Tax=Momordica charantia TaxID=3673 RepID=A0A6J1C5V2_MOMCH|nr:transcription initiation factor TFIID subunit 7-like [Momordica charantia]
MEVLFSAPTFSIEVPPSTAFVGVSIAPENPAVAASCLPQTQSRVVPGLSGSGSGSGSSLGEVSSESSSSIGVPDDDSEDDGGGEEVQSKPKEGGLCGLDSLEDALPIKRGLSSHFSGKSKSFANLSEVIQVKDLEKPENPFNKRRRILMASKWSRKGSFYNWPNPKSMPLLALNEDEEQGEEEEQEEADCSDSEDGDEEDEENERRRRTLASKFHDRKLVNGIKSKSCFDLQEYQHR